MVRISHTNCELCRHLSFRWKMYLVRHYVILILLETVRETRVAYRKTKGANMRVIDGMVEKPDKIRDRIWAGTWKRGEIITKNRKRHKEESNAAAVAGVKWDVKSQTSVGWIDRCSRCECAWKIAQNTTYIYNIIFHAQQSCVIFHFPSIPKPFIFSIQNMFIFPLLGQISVFLNISHLCCWCWPLSTEPSGIKKPFNSNTSIHLSLVWMP